MTANLTPKGTRPNAPHVWEVVATTRHPNGARTERVRCVDCGTIKHRRAER